MTSSLWNIYPRPQMRRNSYLCLNGKWEFTSQPQDNHPSSNAPVLPMDFRIPDVFSDRILVPFVPQSNLSKVTKKPSIYDTLFYRRKVTLPDDFIGKRILLHVGAADQIADVYWNGIHVGAHEGGYLPFTIELTDYLSENTGQEYELVICVKDTLNHTYPYGKQRVDRGGMWYTPVSGIWQTVWMEAVPQQYINGLKITPFLDRVEVAVDADTNLEDISISVSEPRIFPDLCSVSNSRSCEDTCDRDISCKHTILNNGNCFTITPDAPQVWTPEEPYIYEFTVTAGDDTVHSYFALRTLETKIIDNIPRLCLNGKPYFFHGLLDQGYYHDGIFLPETPAGYTKDILTMKELGFNMLRKHIKIEPEYFYTACDYLGMIVFQDFVNNSDYSFIRDTALPTVGLQKLPNVFLRRSDAAKEFFIEHSRDTVNHLYNHPCICQWTVFNEGWGQFDADRLYDLAKSWDSTRFIDTTSGWFRETKSDVESRHVYFKKVKPVKSDKPFFLSEFGGYCYAVESHLYDPDKAYGYRNCKTQEAFMDALEALYLEQIVPLVKEGLCAAVYTQVSDVEEEINGLFTYDREVLKVDKDRMSAIAKQLFKNIG